MDQFDRNATEQVFSVADEMQIYAERKRITRVLEGAILSNMFFEPSTRTRVSFGSAFNLLGGEVRETTEVKDSSLAKGESLYDTARVLSGYSDIIVMRHPEEGSVAEFSEASRVPVINGGDGANEHPSQALLDLYTLYKRFGDDFQYKKILFVGDIKQSRTIHSFVHLLELYPKTQIYFHPYLICEPEDTYINHISRVHNQDETKMIVYGNDIDYGNYDVVYLTRYQKERHVDSASTTMVMSSYRFTYENANDMHENAIIMHPFPRNQDCLLYTSPSPRDRG